MDNFNQNRCDYNCNLDSNHHRRLMNWVWFESDHNQTTTSEYQFNLDSMIWFVRNNRQYSVHRLKQYNSIRSELDMWCVFADKMMSINTNFLSFTPGGLTLSGYLMSWPWGNLQVMLSCAGVYCLSCSLRLLVLVS